MFFKSKWGMAAVEAVYGTAEVLAAEDAIETNNLQLDVYAGDTVMKEVDRPVLGGYGKSNINPHGIMSFDTYAAGSGTAGDAPAWGKILRACGFAQTLTPGQDAVYELVSDGFESLTMSFLRSVSSGTMLKYLLTGCRGDMSLEFNAGALPVFKFSNFMGSWAVPTEVALIAPDTSAFKEPIPVTKDNTPTVTIDGYAAAMKSYSVALGNKLTRRNIPNSQKTILSDRDVTMKMTIVAPDLTTKNFFTALQSHNGITYLSHVMEHGKTAGNILRMESARSQLTKMSETEVDGEQGWDMEFSLVPSDAGDDEFKITAK